MTGTHRCQWDFCKAPAVVGSKTIDGDRAFCRNHADEGNIRFGWSILDGE